MQLLTQLQRRQMLDNGAWNARLAREDKEPTDFHPVVKLFCPWGAATWLLTEIDADEIAFGLCDLGMGFPELGNVSLRELADLRGPGGLGIERDIRFRPHLTLSAYADEARCARRIRA